MDPSKPFKILFLCTGNSARSILAEYIIKRAGRGKFISYSAGSNPKGSVHPMALEVLHKNYNHDVTDARSKSWQEFGDTEFDFVITLCDSAKESCPIWPGQPIVAHWSSPDPAAFEGTDEEKLKFFAQVALQIQRRIDLLCCLPFSQLSVLNLIQETKDIGQKEKIDTQVPSK
jgi:arsenate reductase (thioredoxin)